MFKNTKNNVGNCRILTDYERNNLMYEIFMKKVDGYWIKVKGEVIATRTLVEMLEQVAGRPNITADTKINQKYGVWGMLVL